MTNKTNYTLKYKANSSKTSKGWVPAGTVLYNGRDVQVEREIIYSKDIKVSKEKANDYFLIRIKKDANI